MPPGQPTQEEMQNMSPEQLAELQKKNCIFCKIKSGEVPGKKVYEDDTCFCILDINPATKGHVLILPNEHYQIMPQMPDDVISHVFKIAKAISEAQLKAFKAQGTTIFAANGVVAGQKAPHFMIHVFPRSEGDNIGMVLPKFQLTQQQLNELKTLLQPKIAEAFGAPPPQPEAPQQEPQPEAEKLADYPPHRPLPEPLPQPVNVGDIPEELFTPAGAKPQDLEQEIEQDDEIPEPPPPPENFMDDIGEEDIDLDKMKGLYR